MSILFQCRCGKTLSASDDAAGKNARCPTCKAIVPIPTKAARAAQPVAARQVNQPPKVAPASSSADPFNPALNQSFPAQNDYAAPAPYSPPPYAPPRPKRMGGAKSQSTGAPWLLIAIGAAMFGLLVVSRAGYFVWKNIRTGDLASLGASGTSNDIAATGSAAIQTTNASVPNSDSATDAASKTGDLPKQALLPVKALSSRAAFAIPASDPLQSVINPFLEAGGRGSSTDALKLLNQDEFHQRVRSEKGSEKAQVNGLDTKKLISAFCARSLESMPLNGGVRHWDAVARTKYDGLDAIIVRYYCEPLSPYKWAKDEDSWSPLLPLISFEEFWGAAGGLFKEQPNRPARLDGYPPQTPDRNGLLLPRAGYVTLVFKSVGGQPQLVDIASTISNISLSRASGELFLRDYRIIGPSSGLKSVATHFYPSLFGELAIGPDTMMDNSQFIDPIAYYRRYKEKLPQVEPMPPEYRTNRLERIQRLVRLMDTNDKSLEAELMTFRSDFRNDQAGDMAVVSFAMMRDEPEFQAEAVRGILAATERLYAESGDPYLNYVRWYAPFRSGDMGAARQAASMVAKSNFQTAEWHQHSVETAAKSGQKANLIASLQAYGRWWTPAPVEPPGDSFSYLSGNWAAAKTRLEGREGNLVNRGPMFASGENPGPHTGARNGDPFANPNGQPTPRPGEPGFGPPPRNMAGPSMPQPSGPSVTIRITGSFDSVAASKKLAATLNAGNYSASHSGNVGQISIGYSGDLQTVIDAIDFGTIESSDGQKREIKVKVP